MKILDYLKEEWVLPDLQGTDKASVLKELSEDLAESGQGVTPDELLRVLLEREKLESTGIAEGVAIPHGRLKRLKSFRISFGRSVKGIHFDSIDGKPTHLFFLVLAPEDSAVNNLKLLGRIATLLKDPSFKKRLMESKSRHELFQSISEEDEKY
jgi:PTS system nitrogen regulatory IIA component